MRTLSMPELLAVAGGTRCKHVVKKPKCVKLPKPKCCHTPCTPPTTTPDPVDPAPAG